MGEQTSSRWKTKGLHSTVGACIVPSKHRLAGRDLVVLSAPAPSHTHPGHGKVQPHGKYFQPVLPLLWKHLHHGLPSHRPQDYTPCHTE